MHCALCRKALDPSWNLCPFCGTRAPAPTAIPRESWQATWTAWRLYNRHFGVGLLSYIRDIVEVADDDIAGLVESMRPSRLIVVLGDLMRKLAELAAQPELPTEVRAAVLDLANDNHEAMLTLRLAAASAEVHAAVQALIDAGELDPGFADQVMRYVERRNNASEIASFATALTGVDSGIARMIGLVVASLVETSRANARKQQLGVAWAAMLMTAKEIIEQRWNTLADKCAAAGLLLRQAAELNEVETRVEGLQDQLLAQQQARDGEFEQTLSLVHALAREHPHASSVRSLVTVGELLAEVRSQLLGSWATRLSIGMEAAALARAQQHFLRLYPGDLVLAFFATTVFGQGKAGLVFTTGSVQWLLADATPQRFGYAQLHPEHVRWSSTHMQIGDHQLELLSDTDADAAGRLLRGCLRLLAVRPGPPECICGAPIHWFVYGPDAVHCPGCKATVGYF